MYKLVAITAIDAVGFENLKDPLANSPLVLDNDVVVFCSPQIEEKLSEIRKKYDPDLSKTKFIPFYVHNLDAYHLYYEKLSGKTENHVFVEIVQLNRMAFIRDYFSKNEFKASHAIWIDWNAAFLNDMEAKSIKNLELCAEAQTLFADSTGEVLSELFIVPQEMAWNFYYLNKLEHRESIHHGNLKSHKEYFSILLGKYSNQINLCCNVENLAEKLCLDKQPNLPSSNFPSDKLVAVVNHYQHDTSWVDRLLYNTCVYNKNPNEHHLYNLNLPNVGFDSIVYFTYIIDNYEHLPEYVAFLQDDPFFHCMDVIQIINNFNFDRDFVPMGTSYYLGGHDWKMSEDYAEKVGLQYQRPLKMITSCQSIIKRDLILKRPKEFYQLLVSTIDKTVKCSDNYAIENLWPTIFSFNEELVPCLNCKGHGDKQ